MAVACIGLDPCAVGRCTLVIEGLFNTGSMPVLERMAQFTQQRHATIVDSIANLSTPNYRPVDLDVDSFQAALADAVERRREATGGPNGDLPLRDTRQLRVSRHGVQVRDSFRDENLLFHDRNNRSLERIMQDLAENAMTHNATMEMLRNQFQMLDVAISGRI